MGFRGVAMAFCGLLWTLSCLVAAGQGAKPDEGPKYDPNTVVDFLATITDVQEAPRGSPMNGVHLTVKTKSETLRAYLGPSEFVKSFEVTFAKGDQIQLVGSKVKWGGSQIVLAREIRKEGTTVYLRDKQGSPYWPAS